MKYLKTIVSKKQKTTKKKCKLNFKNLVFWPFILGLPI